MTEGPWSFLPIVVCADDYGLAPGVCDAIEALIALRRLSATAAMVAMPDWRERAPGLRAVVAEHPADVGLHLTLTDHPALSAAPTLAPAGRLPSLGGLHRAAWTRRLPRAEVRAEIDAQLDAFENAWNGPPDFVDGHQHVHLLPVVREELLDALRTRYPTDGARPWLRDCREPLPALLRRGTAVAKGAFLTLIGGALARRAQAAGFPLNRGFRGVYDFAGAEDYGVTFRRFLERPRAGMLVHCHPGTVDAVLQGRDGLTWPRERELAYLASDRCADDLAAAGVEPTRYSRTGNG